MTDRCLTQEHQMAVHSRSQMAEYPVSQRLVLASQPQPDDWARLAARGFRTILNIRQDPERAAVQARAAKAAGLRYVHLPLPAYELEPEHLAEFNQIINRHADDKILFHCRSASRTGLIWMLKRTQFDGLSQAEAEAELRAAGYGDDNIDTFLFCADDYLERTVSPELKLATPTLI